MTLLLSKKIISLNFNTGITKKTRIMVASVVIACSQSAMGNNLLEVYDLALKNDPKLKVARENLNSGLEFKKIARGAFFPQISTFANYKDTNRDTEGEFPITLDQDQNVLTAEIRALRPVNNKSDEITNAWGVSLNQVIFDASLWFEYKKGVFQSRQAELQFSADQQDLIMRVLHSYLEVLRAERNLNISRALEKSEKELLQQSERLRKVGINTNIDVYQAQAALDVSTALRLDDEDRLVENRQALRTITGYENEQLWLLPESLEMNNFQIAELASWLARAKAYNLQIQVADAKQKSANENSKSMKAQHALTVNAEIRYSRNKSNSHEIDNSLPFDFNSNADDGSILINASMPLFSGGQTSARRRQALYQYRSAQEDYFSIIKDIERLTSNAHQNVTSSQHRWNARRDALKSNELALTALKRSYEVGAKGLSDVLVAQKNYYAIKRELSNTQFDFLLGLLQLKLLDSTLSPKDIFDFNALLKPPE